MTSATATTYEAYERLALADPDTPWEWYRGCARRKPDMTQEHNEAASELGEQLVLQLRQRGYRVRMNTGRAKRRNQFAFIPDVFVLPLDLKRPRSESPGGLEAYEQPLPFVCEIWSPSTGEYDADEKLPEYRARGDLEIWRIHPYERTIVAWRRRPGGGYSETHYGPGTLEVPVESLPGVVIAFPPLFE